MSTTLSAEFVAAFGASLPATPAFFINGRPLLEAQPIEAFTLVIDEELAGQ